MNSWLKNILWLTFVVAVFVIMSFVESSKENQMLGLPKISIDVFEDQVFLTEDDIYSRLKNLQHIKDSNLYSELDFNKIESVFDLERASFTHQINNQDKMFIFRA